MTKEEPIRLFLFTDSFIHGGTERQFVQTLRALDTARFDITVCCLKKKGPFLADVEALGFRILEFPICSLYGSDTRGQQATLSERLRNERVQIVHAFDFYTNVFAVPAARRAGVPVVLASRREIAGDRTWKERLAIRYACSLATGIVANSKAAGAVLTSLFGESPEKVTVIPNAIDLSRFQPRRKREDVRRELGVEEGSILIGTVAALRPEKQLDIAIRACALARKEINNLKFAIAGEGRERKRLESLIAELDLQTCVHLIGDRRDIPDLLNAFDVFVLSSQTESFPNAILEAMALGKPVVATRVGGIPEVVAQGVTGFLVPPSDPPTMAKEIFKLVCDADLRATMGSRAKAVVERDFVPEKLAERLTMVYEKHLRQRTAKKRILQIGNYPPPVCGWAIHTQILDRELSKLGLDARVMDIGPGRMAKGRDCVPVFGVLDYAWKLIKFRSKGFTFHAHVNGDSWKGYLLAAGPVLLGYLTGKPSALTFHAGPSQLYFPRTNGFWHAAFRLLFQSCGVIICNHEPVKQLICEVYGVAASRVFAIPALSMQYNEDLPAPLAPEIEAFLTSHTPRIFSYSLFRPEFTIEALFDSFKTILSQYPQAGMLIAGPKEVPQEVWEQMRERGIDESILISGNMAHAEFLTAMQRSDVVVRTHLRDGVCTSVLEALQLGIPVVASEDGLRPPSVIRFAPGDAEDLTLKTLSVLQDLESARRAVVRPEARDHLSDEIHVLLSLLDVSRAPRLHQAGE